MTTRFLLAVSGLLAAVLTSGCSTQHATPPDLVLVSLDTMRADVFAEVAGQDPVLGRVLAASVLFEQAQTPTPLTLPAHVSLMSGLDPNRHGVRNNGEVVPAMTPLLAEQLKAAGYVTDAVVSAFPLDRQFGLARGFDGYDTPGSAGDADPQLALLERSGDVSVDRLLTHLSTTSASTPRFLWLHLFDAHAPYLAHDLPADASDRERYRAEATFVVQQLARVVNALEAGGRPFVLIVVGDHGEGLGDHGEPDHGLLLHGSTVHVPMLWYAPGRYPARRVRDVARLVDVAPTLRALAGAAAVPGDGVDLGPLLEGGSVAIPPAYAETYYPMLAYRAQPLRSVREGDWKVIATRDDAELFQLGDDPGEQHDIAATQADRTAALQLDAWQRPDPTFNATVPAPEVARQLQGLGYVAAGASDATPIHCHPRDVLALHRRLTELQAGLDRLAPAAAVDAARAIARDAPDQPFVQELLASLLLRQGNLAGAIAAFSEASRLNPANPETRYQLASALMRAGRHVDALAHWQALETQQPWRAGVWTNEAAALASLGNWADAWVAAQEGIRLDDRDANAVANAALIAERLGLWKDAAHLQQRLLDRGDAGFREFGRLALNQLRAGDVTAARRSIDAAGATNGPLLALARVLVLLRDGHPDEALAAASRLQQAQPALWTSAVREFPELPALR